MRDRSGSQEASSLPATLQALESALARRIPVSATSLSALRLVVLTPLLLLATTQIGVLPHDPRLVAGLFLAFATLDYLSALTVMRDGAAGRGPGAWLDRIADLPLLISLAVFSLDQLHPALVGAKLLMDALLLGLYARGRDRTENRLRTGLGYATLLSLLLLTQGWGERLVTPDFVEVLLAGDIYFSAIVAAYSLGLIGKFLIADLLSAANLACGVIAMFYAAGGRYEVGLLLLIIGAAFDGLDGAAARRWGGTKWGVYSDDVADAVNYGIAPGVALHFALPGPSGVVLGAFFTVFTLSRLVFFTLNKNDADPNYFAGVPSTIGGLVTVAGIVLFRDQPAILGLMVGVACAQMVSFDTHYRHLGRAVSAFKRQALYGTPLLVSVLILFGRLGGIEAAVAVILGACLVYGFFPTFRAFQRTVKARLA